MALSVGSLFSGIGGIDLGLERAGMDTRWFVEIDPHCRNILARHWPGVPIYGDITAIDWAGVERVDVLAGGFPCQPVSVAGRALAQDDPRWLWPAFRDAIGALRPRYVLVENVPGLLQRGLGIVLGDLAQLGYDAEWECIPAAAVGALHLRNRLWLVAHTRSRGRRRGTGEHSRRGTGSGDRSEDVPHSDAGGWNRRSRQQREGWRAELADGSWWATEPDVGRVAHGVPHRVDRLRALGNAVVPQVVEWIGRRIVAFDEALR